VWPCQVFTCADHDSLAIKHMFASRRKPPRSRMVEFNP
jgi:hypothetical protein